MAQNKTAVMAVLSIPGRSDGVRTHDLYVPNVALYQAELHSDKCAMIMQSFQINCNCFYLPKTHKIPPKKTVTSPLAPPHIFKTIFLLKKLSSWGLTPGPRLCTHTTPSPPCRRRALPHRAKKNHRNGGFFINHSFTMGIVIIVLIHSGHRYSQIL